MKLLIVPLFLIVFFGEIIGQNEHKRFSFAKMYMGLDVVHTPSFGSSSYLDPNNILEDFTRNSFSTPSVNIGATHFWGYADIYVSISTANIQTTKNTVKTNVDYGVFTGLRVYPWQLTDNKLRPFIGYKFSPFRYLQEDINGISSKQTKVKSVIDAGIGYRLPQGYFYLGYNRVINPELTTFISRAGNIETTYPSQFFNIGINWMLETTASANNDVNRQLNDLFSTSNADGFFFGIGPSSAFPLQSSDYITENYPYLDDLTMPTIFPDVSLGYHFTKHDVITSLAFRPITQIRSAFDFRQKVHRNSLVAEAYKVLGDYHGFSPYIGGGVSFENIKLTETDNGVEVNSTTENKIAPVLTFGWDIRPSRKGDFWVLRTNLRYAPTLGLEQNTDFLSLQHLEFNFIQFVFYPQRWKRFKEMK